MAPWTATIVGHSYIKRLSNAVSDSMFSTNFGLEEYKDITFIYRGGAHIDSFSGKLSSIETSSPQVVILQLGGNDFSGSTQDDYKDVYNKLIRLAFEIRTLPSVKVVFIGKLFYRQINSRYLPTCDHVSRYNNKVDYINQHLQDSAQWLNIRHIYIRNHKGRVQMKDHILLPDGVHLNRLGMKKFYRSLRGALIAARLTLVRCVLLYILSNTQII